MCHRDYGLAPAAVLEADADLVPVRNHRADAERDLQRSESTVLLDFAGRVEVAAVVHDDAAVLEFGVEIGAGSPGLPDKVELPVFGNLRNTQPIDLVGPSGLLSAIELSVSITDSQIGIGANEGVIA